VGLFVWYDEGMSADIFIFEGRGYFRDGETSLLVPALNASTVVVIGSLVTDQALRHVVEAMQGDIGPNEVAVAMPLGVFDAAARDYVAERPMGQGFIIPH
jgi:hypothetical protein